MLMDNTTLLWIIGSIIAFIIIAEVLFWLAGKEKKWLFGILYGLVVLTPSITLAMNIWKPMDFVSVIISIIGIIFLIFWGMTLYEEAGNNSRRWYYLTFIIPILMFVYHFVKKNK